MKSGSKVVEYTLEASEFNWEVRPGKIISAWGFNNQVPGPQLKAKKGDTMVVKVINNLPEATMVHWHGLRLPASMDGTGEVQKPIEPGEVFEYRFVVPDAGTFWYHAHQNETVQMERGLYGALIVSDETELIVDDEKIFMIDDMKLNKKNGFTKPTWFLPRMIERHDGRQGNTLLLNGKENLVVDVNGGQTERWRFINSSSARYFHLYLGGKKFKIIGSDGGMIETSIVATDVLITPGERIDIAVGPFKEGESFLIESLAYNRTTVLVKAKRETFATVMVNQSQSTRAFIPESLRKIKALANQDAIVNRKIEFSVGMLARAEKDFRVN